jgi:hypothetical protein
MQCRPTAAHWPFRHHVTDLWRHTLRRRSQKDRITWAQMTQLANAWLPKPIILHPWPSARFAVTHLRWEMLWGGGVDIASAVNRWSCPCRP